MNRSILMELHEGVSYLLQSDQSRKPPDVHWLELVGVEPNNCGNNGNAQE